MLKYIERGRRYFSQHVMLGHFAHAVGAIGFTLLVQQYLKGNAFLPMWAAWLMVLLAIAIHVKSWMSEY